MARARDWSTRIHCEAQLHESNEFVTLTYSDTWVPDDYSVSVRALQLFMKRLRKRKGRVRFFGCGEYGESTYRPHYHVILFGCEFADKFLWRTTASGYPVYRSPELEKLWPFGLSEIGTVTVQSAGYVARYCMKKVTGDRAESHYQRINPLTGELVSVRPEFIVMSNKPGIGREWYDTFSADCFPSDFLVVDGSKVPVPRYFRKRLDERETVVLLAKRKAAARAHAADQTPERLAVREELQELRAQLLPRSMEQES